VGVLFVSRLKGKEGVKTSSAKRGEMKFFHRQTVRLLATNFAGRFFSFYVHRI
jgi:hypothetical protein